MSSPVAHIIMVLRGATDNELYNWPIAQVEAQEDVLDGKGWRCTVIGLT